MKYQSSGESLWIFHGINVVKTFGDSFFFDSPILQGNEHL